MLRKLLTDHHLQRGVQIEPSALHLFSTHSCKTTLLCWSQQLSLSEEARRLQGHHRASGHMASVALYSRSDVFPALDLQRSILKSIAQGFRPLRPMLRGGAPPVLDFEVTIPRWLPSSVPKGVVVEASVNGSCEKLQSPAHPTVPGDDMSDSEADSIPPVAEADPQLIRECDEFFYIVNVVTHVAHIALPCSPDDPRGIVEAPDKSWLRPACGARPSILSGDLVFAEQLTQSSRLCLRKGCIQAVS